MQHRTEGRVGGLRGQVRRRQRPHGCGAFAVVDDEQRRLQQVGRRLLLAGLVGAQAGELLPWPGVGQSSSGDRDQVASSTVSATAATSRAEPNDRPPWRAAKSAARSPSVSWTARSP
ncbi:hypothetical protein STVIR_0967 [Streptomyces viridochromogenes Tue57]|uniref:Uncharacterized protein n=1 Tax=Streptomyces viridochromogenes Tue57 TaxID=1160705 RepID=L8PPF8_STRVR|nr:hypothetical protein STVIR_0967 [Streptomyces viridochromogenes Tue57]